jgi:hypothetical protein
MCWQVDGKNQIFSGFQSEPVFKTLIKKRYELLAC